MTGFLLAAAGLVAATLLLMLRPWQRTPRQDATSSRDINAGIYRDQLRELDRDLAAGTISAPDHAQARAELERRVIDDVAASEASATPGHIARRTYWLLALAFPLCAAGLYTWLGTPAALDPRARQAVTRDDVDQMVAGLAARLEKNPSDTKGWIVLARSYRALNKLPQAQNAYEHIGATLNDDPTLLAEYADVLATRAMGNLEGKPIELVNRALQLDPNHVMALSLSASAAFTRKDFAQAVAQWERLQKLVPADSDEGKWLTQAIAQVRTTPTATPATASAPKSTTRAAPSAALSISGRVSLSPALKAKVQPGDTVFVFARATQGPRMPLAVQRTRVSELPFAFRLDDTMAMSPQLKLSSVPEVRIEARISRSGSATPEPGDLIGVGPVVKLGASQVAVQIDQVRP